MTDAEEARSINPFKLIQKGEDSVNVDDDLVFADFRPNILPADTPEHEVVSPNPKAVSAPEPAPSSGSAETTGQTKSETPVQQPAGEDDGQSSPGVDLRQSSSSA